MTRTGFLCAVALAALSITGISLSGEPAWAQDAEKASLTMTIQPLGYVFKDDRHRFMHHRIFIENAGVGVTLTSGTVCVDHGNECVSGMIEYRIDPNSAKSRRDQYVATKTLPDVASVEYKGTDDNGNPVVVRAEIPLDNPEQ